MLVDILCVLSYLSFYIISFFVYFSFTFFLIVIYIYIYSISVSIKDTFFVPQFTRDSPFSSAQSDPLYICYGPP